MVKFLKMIIIQLQSEKNFFNNRYKKMKSYFIINTNSSQNNGTH